MDEKDRQNMISAIKVMKDICERNYRKSLFSCDKCLFNTYCSRPLGIPIPKDWNT